MAKIFNVNGACIPELHYMVDLTSRLQETAIFLIKAGHGQMTAFMKQRRWLSKRTIPYVATADYIRDAAMFGFIKNENHMVMIANRIFEAVLYEYFTAEEYIGNQMYDISSD